MESSLCEKPERHASRRLSDHLMFEGQKQKAYSPEDKVVQPCLTDPFSSDLARPFMKAECGKMGSKSPQQDRSHKRWREANGGAQCGKSACCVRRGGD